MNRRPTHGLVLPVAINEDSGLLRNSERMTRRFRGWLGLALLRSSGGDHAHTASTWPAGGIRVQRVRLTDRVVQVPISRAQCRALSTQPDSAYRSESTRLSWS